MRFVEQGSRRIAKLMKQMPQAKGYVQLSDRLLFATLQHQIVCIDDLERAGRGLAKIDVLGLVSELREQKRCKVVLLLNNEELGDDRETFEAHIEKVADTVIRFDPTPAEAAEIAIGKGSTFHTWLAANCQTLRITNIRVIARIERLAHRMEDVLGELDSRIFQQAVHTLTLAAFAKFQPSVAPSLEYVRNFQGPADLVGPEDPDPHTDWRALLSDYKFGHVDELDLAVLDGVERGYFDTVALLSEGRAKQIVLNFQDKDNSFTKAWERYHESFENDGEEVLDDLFQSLKTNAAAISPLNLSGTARLFKELGRPAQSRELVEFYVGERNEARKFWNLDGYPFRGSITDPDVVELFTAKFHSMQPPVADGSEILLRISRQSGWNPEDLDSLSQLTVDDFYRIFKKSRGDDLNSVTREALRFSNRGAAGSTESTIGQNANEALDRIAAESPINARRVRQRRSEA
jgi:hypothetical protein